MHAAQQHQICQISWATVYPMFDVVGVALPRWPVASRKGAATVTEDQRTPLRVGRGAVQQDLTELRAQLLQGHRDRDVGTLTGLGGQGCAVGRELDDLRHASPWRSL